MTKKILWFGFALLLSTGCTVRTATSPQRKGVNTLPKGVWSDGAYVRNVASIEVRGKIADVYDYIVHPNTPQNMLRGRGLIPGIAKYDIIRGPWDHAGALRKFTFKDRSTSLEEIKALKKPHYFAYRVFRFSSALKDRIDYIYGEWFFRQIGDKVRVEWRYSLKVKDDCARPTVNYAANQHIFPFMKDGMQRMKRIVEASIKAAH